MVLAASFRPLFLCPGGRVAGTGAAIPLALFLDVTKMMLGAFWVRFWLSAGCFPTSAGELDYRPFLALSDTPSHANKTSTLRASTRAQKTPFRMLVKGSLKGFQPVVQPMVTRVRLRPKSELGIHLLIQLVIQTTTTKHRFRPPRWA